MNYKVGDFVRVRYDLVAGERYGKDTFVTKMKEYCGHVFKVDTVLEPEQKYFLDQRSNRQNNRPWFWTDEMLEPAIEIKPVDVASLADILLI